jgi:flagellar basal-body rod protein FlgG
MAGIPSVVSGMHALWARHETVANNLANVSTPGFKRDDVLVLPAVPPPTQTAAAGGVLSPVYQAPAIQWTDYSQGPLLPTGRELDAALTGSGFFVVDTPAGERYMRNGTFHVSPDGFLVTAGGARVLGERGPIAIPPGRLAIGGRGDVQVNGKTVGTLRVVDFPAPLPLLKTGGSLFAPTSADVRPAAATGYEVVGGALEGSNVNAVEAMVRLIEILRTYEAAQRAIQAADEVDGQAVNEVGRVS